MNTSFKFKLQKVLDYKELQEKQKMGEMANAMQLLQEEKKALDRLLMEKEWTFSQMNVQSSKGVQAGYLTQYNRYLESLNTFIDEQRTSLNLAENKVDRCRESLVEASVNKKIMDKLKEKYYHRFLYQINREQEKEVEDVVNFNTIKV